MFLLSAQFQIVSGLGHFKGGGREKGREERKRGAANTVLRGVSGGAMTTVCQTETPSPTLLVERCDFLWRLVL